ncbi:CAF17-like 4Fe-4S cluster assembly/insertion protein YgfZ [Baaleninema simplex]|uniref:CAF17-like 4Fe-4S cluster assembly/insertion protein YgfZ n=1 Tax=Baaleninema simplex TaxID=2862350 RepID=UPI00034D8B72|nr:folate-binding protein YgfZ [Baaleninema simplex]
MNQALREIQTALGAKFGEIAPGVEAPLSFGNDADALNAARTGVALYDRTAWGRLQLTQGDRLRFVHNQSTNEFNSRQPGEACDTVFLTNTARTLDLATAYITDDALLLLVSPSRRETLMKLLDRYIFPADKVELSDRTDDTACFTLIGEESRSLLEKLGISDDISPGTHRLVTLNTHELRIAAGSGLSLPGYTLICNADAAAELWKTLYDTGATPLGETLWNRLRIEQGRPAPDAELTDDYNPLEAGLWHTISFDKGCYIGQETIARLNTYKGVKQQLWGLRLNSAAEPGTPITLEDSKIGKLTSIVSTEDGYVGLGYIRTKAGGKGLSVTVGDAIADVVDVPFLSRGYLAEAIG